ncbi:MAG TPA: glutamate--tRNA ligase, partial [Porphyromonadaceae bacterium]|nr:glutamate--tRNA ligase [Porphyromonadaceae bacterium]
RLNNVYTDLAERLNIKMGALMWPIRIAVSGQAVTPGTAPEIMSWIGKEESISRLEEGIKKLGKFAGVE